MLGDVDRCCQQRPRLSAFSYRATLVRGSRCVGLTTEGVVVTVHPQIEALLIESRALPRLDPSTMLMSDRRRMFNDLAMNLWKQPTPMFEVTEIDLPLASGPLRTRLYVPSENEHRGLILYFHGGSFVVGNLDTHDGLCRRLAADTSMHLLAVDYRLAPEHPFPAAVTDATDALRYVATHLEQFGGSDFRLIVMGDSAGATLAAVAAAEVRHDHINLAAQVLVYPTFGPELLTASAREFGTGYFLEVDHLRYDYEQYLGTHTNHADPRVTPLMNLDLSGSAPAIIVVAECDPLRDEAVAYAGLLEHFGTPVELLQAEGMIHGFLRLGEVVPDAFDIVDDIARHLHRFVQTE